MAFPNIAPSHKGMLHKALHVPAGQPIPESKLKSAEHSSNAHVRHMADYAAAAKHFNHAHNEAPKSSGHAASVASMIKSHKHGA